VGLHGYNLLTIGYTKPVAALAELTRIYRDAFAAARSDGGRATIATHYHTLVAEDRTEARRIAEQRDAEWCGAPPVGSQRPQAAFV
jgi:alkanesulfonate monooxygenase SsuD/methylene tetrahydromethanopterin reductase-like flavin-dependent oxidoreductase (luciferase family)